MAFILLWHWGSQQRWHVGDLRFCLEEDQSKCSVLFPERGLEIFLGAS